MLAAGNSPSITKWPMSERCLLHFGIKHREPEIEAGRPFSFFFFLFFSFFFFFVVWTGGKLNYTGLIPTLNAFLLPPLGSRQFWGL